MACPLVIPYWLGMSLSLSLDSKAVLSKQKMYCTFLGSVDQLSCAHVQRGNEGSGGPGGFLGSTAEGDQLRLRVLAGVGDVRELDPGRGTGRRPRRRCTSPRGTGALGKHQFEKMQYIGTV